MRHRPPTRQFARDIRKNRTGSATGILRIHRQRDQCGGSFALSTFAMRRQWTARRTTFRFPPPPANRRMRRRFYRVARGNMSLAATRPPSIFFDMPAPFAATETAKQSQTISAAISSGALPPLADRSKIDGDICAPLSLSARPAFPDLPARFRFFLPNRGGSLVRRGNSRVFSPRNYPRRSFGRRG